MSRHWFAAVVAGTAALAALAGCSTGSDSGGGESAGDAAVGEDRRGPGFAEPGAGVDPAAPPGEDAPGQQPDDGGAAGGAIVDIRSIIYTGAITVRVADVDRAATEATALAERLGGFVGGDHRTAAADADQAQARLVLRIPADEFTAAVDQLAALGAEESREVETEDVTEEVVDLENRIATAQASVDRTRALMQQARSIDDIVSVEAELSEREAALASLQARQRRLADLSALSTITATLLAESASPVTEEADETGFLAGLAAGWGAFTTSVTVLLTGLGVLLPWLVVIGAPTAAGVWWARRRRAGQLPAPGPTAPWTEGRQ